MHHVVVIYARGCENRVVPGQLVVLPRDTVSFQVINTDATLLFPQRILLDEEKKPVQMIRLAPEERPVSASLTIEGSTGVYSYAVHCAPQMSFAKGASDPVIIIRRMA